MNIEARDQTEDRALKKFMKKKKKYIFEEGKRGVHLFQFSNFHGRAARSRMA